jgi:hypothetical protein
MANTVKPLLRLEAMTNIERIELLQAALSGIALEANAANRGDRVMDLPALERDVGRMIAVLEAMKGECLVIVDDLPQVAAEDGR